MLIIRIMMMMMVQLLMIMRIKTIIIKEFKRIMTMTMIVYLKALTTNKNLAFTKSI